LIKLLYANLPCQVAVKQAGNGRLLCKHRFPGTFPLCSSTGNIPASPPFLFGGGGGAARACCADRQWATGPMPTKHVLPVTSAESPVRASLQGRSFCVQRSLLRALPSRFAFLKHSGTVSFFYTPFCPGAYCTQWANTCATHSRQGINTTRHSLQRLCKKHPHRADVAGEAYRYSQ